MSEPEDNGSDPNKTVFMPSGDAAPAPPPADRSDADKTRFMDKDDVAAALTPAPSTPAAKEGRIAVGMTLNHIFEVRRFIARGGMGEVYEGVNINTDERVAIKVILSHLALDEAVQAMFRKEARTLTRLSHPALVQYRVLAQEPTLGVLYIVTEYIDGAQLSDVIGAVRPSADELIGLTRRLASGLQAAHELGAIHRDIAPDNVLLPDGRLHEAKVIDFGIAKDLDPTNKTIVGDGFAGKLGFVAPEQFGDFNREVGPWTDVYSLALVILSVAAGKPIDMGATLVEAIEKRRAGPDLSVAPERLRPVLAGMLRPNPAERFRSMAEVLQALDQATEDAPITARPASATAAAPAKKSSLPLLAAAAIVLLLLSAAGAYFLTRHPAKTSAAGAETASTAATGGVRDSEKVRQAIETALPTASCSWIDIEGVSDGPNGVTVRLSGVAGSPASAQQAIAAAAQATGAHVGLIDASNVFPVASGNCAPLDAFRAFREPSSELGRRFTSPQANWELSAKNDPCVGPNAKVVVNLNIGNPQQNFSIIGMDKNGGLQQIFNDRAAFNAYHAQFPEFVTDKGGDSFSSTACYNETGIVGQLLVTGTGPFDLGLPNALTSSKSQSVDAAWIKRFADAAKAGGWKTNMVWYRVVDDQPG